MSDTDSPDIAAVASLPPNLSRRGLVHPRFDARLQEEFHRNWGLMAIRATAAYEAGATGRGVTIAIIDTGIETAPPDVLRNVSPDSIDLIQDRRDSGVRTHGARIASALAAAQDGAGIIGVAPEVTVLSVRADLDLPCRKAGCLLTGSHVARGIDYALAQGAQVIILSLAGGKPLTSLEPALERAAKAGAVLVVAAGNEGGHQTAWPARYGADPRLADSIMAVGAATRAGTLAKFSNRAGKARDRYLIAPGDKINVECDAHHCEQESGTSFATAYVAGAIALLLDAFPALDAQTAARLLLDCAHDMGQSGVDAVTGHGHIDLAKAFDRARTLSNRELAADFPTS
ncbi:S8 family peptidase [Pedomonas sp. V897]|uniref:S8 family peptidase n=1 Tax=Pedomonas sp. V897 TaxID=3446482 RepID=UPI003EE3F268